MSSPLKSLKLLRSMVSHAHFGGTGNRDFFEIDCERVIEGVDISVTLEDRGDVVFRPVSSTKFTSSGVVVATDLALFPEDGEEAQGAIVPTNSR